MAGGHVTAIALVVNQDAPLRRLERLDHDLRKDHTSARLSTALPLACSGDIYAAVPRMIPARVAAAVSVGASDGSPSGSGGKSEA